MATPQFNLVLPSKERQMLKAVARHLERTESDAVRWLIRQAATKGLLPPEQAQTFATSEPAGLVRRE